ncbi:MAG: glycosyltransferase [Actinobacteria bacterium]|nr:glycosyltransferase [Actinomycetota bacterium]
MPVFNGGEYLLDAVEGALVQLREDDELLLQDGGSTDGSLDVLRETFGHYPQLKIVSRKDDGQADALNLALARAQNPIIGWLNADDRINPGAVDAVRRAWVAHPDADIVYGSWQIFGNDGAILRDCVPKEFTLESLTWQPHVFTGAIYYDRNLLREHGAFDVDMHYCMDLDLVLRLATIPPRCVQVPEVLGSFRWHDDSKTGQMNFGIVKEAYVVRRRYARGLRGHLYADLCSLVHLVAWLALPLRQARWYSRLRTKAAQRRAAGAV